MTIIIRRITHCAKSRPKTAKIKLVLESTQIGVLRKIDEITLLDWKKKNKNI